MKILLVYEEVPEATHLYSLDVDDETALKIARCHRLFVNSEMTNAEEKCTEWLSKFLEGKPKLDDKEAVNLAGHDLLVISGFIL